MNTDISAAWIVVITLLVVWELFWKGIGLWKAARNEQKGWYIAILLINTAGILPMIYIFLDQSKTTAQK